MNTYAPVLLMLAIAVGLSVTLLVLSRFLGPRRPLKSKNTVYECGLEPVGSARERFSVKFYLVALLFIVFDIEVVFIYPWAITYKNSIREGNGLYMLAVMGIFFVPLVLGFIYEWRQGALDWSGKKC